MLNPVSIIFVNRVALAVCGTPAASRYVTLSAFAVCGLSVVSNAVTVRHSAALAFLKNCSITFMFF